jgi:hypothetical protein
MRLPPEMFDPVRRHPLQVTLEHVFGHLADDFRRETGSIDLANTSDSAGCFQSYEYEIPPPKARRRRADNKSFQ